MPKQIYSLKCKFYFKEITLRQLTNDATCRKSVEHIGVVGLEEIAVLKNCLCSLDLWS